MGQKEYENIEINEMQCEAINAFIVELLDGLIQRVTDESIGLIEGLKGNLAVGQEGNRDIESLWTMIQSISSKRVNSLKATKSEAVSRIFSSSKVSEALSILKEVIELCDGRPCLYL